MEALLSESGVVVVVRIVYTGVRARADSTELTAVEMLGDGEKRSWPR